VLDQVGDDYACRGVKVEGLTAAASNHWFGYELRRVTEHRVRPSVSIRPVIGCPATQAVQVCFRHDVLVLVALVTG